VIAELAERTVGVKSDDMVRLKQLEFDDLTKVKLESLGEESQV
jgi:hypothetical protein